MVEILNTLGRLSWTKMHDLGPFPWKNPSQRLDLPQDYLATQQTDSQNVKAGAMMFNWH